MGRRKKEPKSVHRKNIADAASRLFQEKGVPATSMDDIAREAGYSKATLYVYFSSKEELVGLLALESMRKLYDCIVSAMERERGTRKRYDLICQGLLEYQEEFPFYFKLALEEIPIHFENLEDPKEVETYRIGEAINEKIKELLEDGVARKELREDLEVLPTIFSFWGSLSGLIQLAANKEAYIERAMGVGKAQFLEKGFDLLYRSIAGGTEEVSRTDAQTTENRGGR